MPNTYAYRAIKIKNPKMSKRGYISRYLLILKKLKIKQYCTYKELQDYIAKQAYTTPFTLTENPVLSMPISISKESLPIGIQVIGKRYSDFRLLKIGMVLDDYSEKFKYPLE